MMKSTEYRTVNRQGLVHLIIGTLIFGSTWGLLEATLGGFLHMILFPNKGAIMSGIGVAIMASALAIYKKPAMAIGIGIVSASFKLLDVWIFNLSIASIHIINPAMAIIFEALAFSLVASLLMNKIARNISVGIGAGVIAGLISAAAYVYFAIYVMNAHLLNRVITTPEAFITNQGLVQAAFLGVLLPLGYLAGEQLAKKPLPTLTSVPSYATAAGVIIFCWLISGLVKVGGIS